MAVQVTAGDISIIKVWNWEDIVQKSFYHTLHQVYRLFRSKRLKLLYDTFEITETTRLLDIGGELHVWELAQEMGYPLPQITIINIYPYLGSLPPHITWEVGNGCQLPFADKSFDIVFSNSVIEHVATWEAQQQFAKAVQRIGKQYFLQTPNKWFPFEFHLLSPFTHWFPKSVQRYLATFTLYSLVNRPSAQALDNMIFHELRLLSKKEFQQLFSDALLIEEKLLGWTKSFYALKR